jgi:hypothetical protein
MLLNSFKYSLKIWLTSVAITPLLFIVMSFQQDDVLQKDIYKLISDTTYLYFMIFAFELLFSFVTWVIFLIIIQLTVTYVKTRITRVIIISLAGILLTMGTFMIILSPSDVFNVTRGFGAIFLCTCFCIGAGSWYYRLAPKPEPEIIIN